MLLKEIGRFGDSVENLRPSDLIKEIPNNLREGCVGIFWHVGDNQWIIRTSPVLDDTKNTVEMGQNYDEDANPDDLQIDFNSFHKDVWNIEILPKKPEWKDFSFDHYSRGRIVFEILRHKFIIYTPNSTDFSQQAVLFLARMFQLPLGGFDTNNEVYRKKKDLESLSRGKNQVLPL